jgi:hypothetical protein
MCASYRVTAVGARACTPCRYRNATFRRHTDPSATQRARALALRSAISAQGTIKEKPHIGVGRLGGASPLRWGTCDGQGPITFPTTMPMLRSRQHFPVVEHT